MSNNNNSSDFTDLYQILVELKLLDGETNKVSLVENNTNFDNQLEEGDINSDSDIDSDSDSNSDSDSDSDSFTEFINALAGNDCIDGWDYKALYGQKALDELINARMARHRNIVIREFTNRLPDLTNNIKNKLFDAFSSSSTFNVEVHNKLLDTLAHPIYGWNLQDYDDY